MSNRTLALTTGEVIDLDNPPEPTLVPLAQIKATQATQIRVGLNERTVEEYRALVEDGSEPPPGWAVRDNDTIWLADAFHRNEALRRAGRESQELYIVQGTKGDAIRLGLAKNRNNPLALSYADRQRAAFLLLDEDQTLTVSQIADAVGVARSTASTYRAAWESATGIVSHDRTYVQDGQVRHANVSGKRQRDPLLDNASAADYTPPEPTVTEPPSPPQSTGSNGSRRATQNRAPEPPPTYSEQGYLVREEQVDEEEESQILASLLTDREPQEEDELLIAPEPDTPPDLKATFSWTEDGERLHAYEVEFPEPLRHLIWRSLKEQKFA